MYFPLSVTVQPKVVSYCHHGHINIAVPLWTFKIKRPNSEESPCGKALGLHNVQIWTHTFIYLFCYRITVSSVSSVQESWTLIPLVTSISFSKGTQSQERDTLTTMPWIGLWVSLQMDVPEGDQGAC